ncbi:MAG TPA: T9SS type B sorting domain-containing protein, partial [Candidatus Nanopusillus sp.]|nr:T9SS type B sorting domain-containing protein [Candidatus Nanopusillus sp.]
LNCFKSISVNIEEPTDSILIILDSINNVSCNSGSDGEINISISGGTIPYSYSWTGGSVFEDLINAQAGTYTFTVTDDNGCTMSIIDSILEPTALSLSLITDTITCFGGDTCIDATISGGILPYTFLWNDALAQTTEDICDLQSGNYILTVTDSNSCIISENITINEVPEIVLTLDSTNILCKGENNGTATVTAIGGSGTYTYLWDDALAQTTATASNLVAGYYTVIVTDANDLNCFKSISVNIEEPTDSLQADLNNLQNVLCFGQSTGAINVDITGGTSPYNYNWTNGVVSEDLVGVIANSYTLTVTDDNNCTTMYSDLISEPLALNITIDSTNNIGCFNGNDGDINISVSGGITPYTYAWTNGEITDDISNLTSGSYTVIVTDSNSCSLSETVTLTQPADVIINFNYSDYNGVNVSCNGSNDGTVEAIVSSGGSPFTYNWDNFMTGNPITGISANTPINVTVTDINGCNYIEAITPLIEPTLLTLTKDSINVDCAGANNGTATVNPNGGTSPYSYSWSNGQNSQTATNLSPNTYSCNVTDANGCTEFIIVTIEEPTPIVVSTQMDSVRCWGGDDGIITLTATGGSSGNFQYSIDGGANWQDGVIFSGLTAGVYDDIIVREIGNEDCLASTVSEVVMQPEPMFIFINPDDTTIQLDETVALNILVDPSTGYYPGTTFSTNDITNISWNPTNGLNCADCLNPTVLTYDYTNVYTATVTYSHFGCVTDATATINVENNLKYFIPSGFSPNNDGINDMFFVYGEGLKEFNIVIFNRWGEKVFETNVQSKGWDGTFKGVKQNPGIYTYGFEATYLDDKEISFKGSITLIK